MLLNDRPQCHQCGSIAIDECVDGIWMMIPLRRQCAITRLHGSVLTLLRGAGHLVASPLRIKQRIKIQHLRVEVAISILWCTSRQRSFRDTRQATSALD